MKKLFVLFFVFLFFISAAGAAERKIIRQNPYINNPYYRHPDYFIEEVLPDNLTALEKYSMNRSYRREHPLRRLERLESLAFGSVQSGDIALRYKNLENAILSRPAPYTKRTALGTLANYFAGQATGLTPSLFTNFGNGYSYDNFGYNPYINGSSTRRIEQYSNGIFGSGYRVMNNSLGNGSSVRILD